MTSCDVWWSRESIRDDRLIGTYQLEDKPPWLAVLSRRSSSFFSTLCALASCSSGSDFLEVESPDTHLKGGFLAISGPWKVAGLPWRVSGWHFVLQHRGCNLLRCWHPVTVKRFITGREAFSIWKFWMKNYQGSLFPSDQCAFVTINNIAARV